MTGLTDRDLAGQSFDAAEIVDLLQTVDVIAAHNAAFDCPFMSRLFPNVQTPWADSLTEIDWASHGYGQRRNVEALLTAAGWFPNSSHRAGPDAWATACLLARTARDGRTLAWHLVERAKRPTARLYAERSPISTKDTLKAAGYRWDPRRRAWWREGEPELIANESAWLSSLHPAIVPCMEARTWHDRWSI